MKSATKKRLDAEFVRNPYNYDADEVSKETGLMCLDKTRAQQQFKEESDINFIANRYGLTGEMPQLPDGFTWGAEFDEVFDFQTAQNALVAGKNAFMALPAKLRARFSNDPQELMDFLQDSSNDDEARKLGLKITPPDVPQSPPSDTGAKGKGDTLSQEPEAPVAPPKTPKKDT